MDIVSIANKIARRTDAVDLQKAPSILRYKIEQVHKKLVALFNEVKPNIVIQQEIENYRLEFRKKKAEIIAQCDLAILNLKMEYMEKEITCLDQEKNANH